MTEQFGWALILAGSAAITAPLFLRPLLRQAGAIDKPNHRSSHLRPTIRGGGLAQLLGLVLGGVMAVTALPTKDHTVLAVTVLSAGAVVGLVGLIEDLRGVSVKIRMTTQLCVGIGLSLALARVTDSPWSVVPLCSVFFAANVNFANFMDGINGMSAFHGGAAGLSYFAIGFFADSEWMMVIGALVAVVYLAFLPWNFTPPGMFLGDVGSYLLGGTLGALCIGGLLAGLPVIVALAPLSVYLTDTVFTLVRRALRREQLHQAHRTHVYQQLTDTGMSHPAVASLVAGLTVCATLLGLLTFVGRVPMWVIASATVALLVVYASLPALLPKATQPTTRAIDVTY